MDDVSDNTAIIAAGELRNEPQEQQPVRGARGAEQHRVQSDLPARIGVSREEIAILKAFLSTEIDAIIFAGEHDP